MKPTSGKFVEGDQVYFASYPPEQFDQALGVGAAIVHTG
jgi:hypothetical protein